MRNKMNNREKKLLKIINKFDQSMYFGIDQDGQVVVFNGDTFVISPNRQHWLRGCGKGACGAVYTSGTTAGVESFKGDGWSKKVYKFELKGEVPELIIYKKDDSGIFKKKK